MDLILLNNYMCLAQKGISHSKIIKMLLMLFTVLLMI